MNGDASYPKRGEVYWVSLDPTIGSETKKTRPGLILSNDIGNEVSNIVIVAPISSKVKEIYPFEAKILLNGRKGKILLNQCRAIDKARLGKKIGCVSLGTLKAVEEALKIVFAFK